MLNKNSDGVFLIFFLKIFGRGLIICKNIELYLNTIKIQFNTTNIIVTSDEDLRLGNLRDFTKVSTNKKYQIQDEGQKSKQESKG